MFQNILKQHRQKQAQSRKELDHLRVQCETSLSNVSSALLSSVNDGVATVYTNQQKLEQEAKALQAQSIRFQKQSAAWLTMYRDLNTALLELGDVKHWAQTIESDMYTISHQLATIVHIRRMDELMKRGMEKEKQRAAEQAKAVDTKAIHNDLVASVTAKIKPQIPHDESSLP